MPNHPLAEVFGVPVDNMTDEAARYRNHRLCPFNNKIPNCTKDKANDPLGTCGIRTKDADGVAITCPIRFRQNWIIADDAARFFFPKETTWTSLTEVRLADREGVSAGNIDVVLVAYDGRGIITDFGAIEVQAVYISGNIRNLFTQYMQNPPARLDMSWPNQSNYPRPDYLSSSRKRLAPQLIYKGGILKAWGKKISVVLNRGFFNHLPGLTPTPQERADIAWLVYDLELDEAHNCYNLVLGETIYTEFDPALLQITRTDPGDIDQLLGHLQSKLDDKLEGTAPISPTLTDDLEF